MIEAGLEFTYAECWTTDHSLQKMARRQSTKRTRRKRRKKKKKKTTKKERATAPRQRRAVRKDSQIRILRWGTRQVWRQSAAVRSPFTVSVACSEASILTASHRCPAAQVSCSPEGMREDGGGE